MPQPAFHLDPLDRVRRPLLALALLVPAPTIGAAMALWIAPGPIGATIYSIAKVWLLALPLIWTLVVDRRTPQSAIRSRPPSIWAGMPIAAGLGALIAVVIIGLFFLMRDHIDATNLRRTATEAGFGSPKTYILFGLYLCLVNALLEEYVWRWFTYRAAASIIPAALAVPLSALFFTLHHILVLAAYFPVWLTTLTSLGVFIGGCTWSWCYARFHSVWPGYVSHAIVDVAILFVGWLLLFE